MQKKRNSIVQLDVDDPINERKQGQKRRLRLNNAEIDVLRKRELINKILVLLIENKQEMPDVISELGLSYEDLNEIAVSEEYTEVRAELSRRASDMFLSLDPSVTRRNIADALGLTEKQLIRLTNSKEFRETYNQFFLELTSDPAIQATRKRIVEDLLPVAFQTLQWELSAEAPSTVRQKARQDVFKLAGVKEIEARTNDRQEAARFLAQIGIGKVELVIPQEYQQALADVVDADVVDIPDDID